MVGSQVYMIKEGKNSLFPSLYDSVSKKVIPGNSWFDDNGHRSIDKNQRRIEEEVSHNQMKSTRISQLINKQNQDSLISLSSMGNHTQDEDILKN
ncbi:hypothetical protein Pfo_018065 [Paulownia fortunei]|nr:hypothetical protein Pfo_018065 [Paulownia fortunei]